MNRVILAFQFLTRLPTGQVTTFREEDLGLCGVYFPLVGLVIGAAVAVPLALLDGRPLVAGVFALLVWVWITGALHLDGLGDVADALGAAHRAPERFLEVLKDPHLGAFGVVTITMHLLVKWVLLTEVARSGLAWVVILIPAWSRWGSMVWSRAIPPLQQGLAEQFSWQIGWLAITAWAIPLAAASVWAAPELCAAIPLAAIVVLYWRRKLGGVTGDCLGASIEVSESILLAALLAGCALWA
jgi:adenosylcobinamide-GDP ribazoletransferase